MMTPVRRRLAAFAMVLLVPTLGACGIGFGYQTDQVYQPSVGVNDRSGTVQVFGAVVVSGSDGTGTFVASFVNKDFEETATLVSISGEGVEAQISSPIQVEPDTLVNLADTGSVGVTGTEVTPGKFVRLTLTFESGQATEINVPVVRDDEEFEDVKLATTSS